ncbi:MAG: PilN domain-containing protein [Phycisphaerales bacterium]
MTCAIYGLGWLGVLGLVGATALNDDAGIRDELRQVNDLVAESESELAALRGELAQSRAELTTSLTIGKQPDWSALLALLSTTLGDRIILRNCKLTTLRKSPGARGPVTASTVEDRSVTGVARESTTIQLQLDGFGLAQQAVSEFVLRLEETSLFRQVKLLDTRREPFLDSDAIAFHIECLLETEEARQP